MSTVGIAVPRARFVAAILRPDLQTIADIRSAVTTALGMAQDATVIDPATVALGECEDDLGNFVTLLESLANYAEAADSGATGADLAAFEAPAISAKMRLDEGVADGVGSGATDQEIFDYLIERANEANGDIEDPTLEDDDEAAAWVHLGHLPLWDDANGPLATDLDQGSLGDCWMLAGIGSIAHADPDRLQDMITDNGNGTYTVNFPDRAITVDDEFPVDADGRPIYAGRGQAGMVLWPAVLEKAWAMRDGGSYGDIAGGTSHNVWTTFGADEDRRALNPAMWRDPSDSDVEGWIQKQLDENLPIATRSDGAFGMGGSHAWLITDVETVGGETTVTVMNPWGVPGIKPNTAGDGFVYNDGTTPVDFANGGDGAGIVIKNPNEGLIEMPIDVFTENFDHVDAVTSWDS